MEEKIEVVSNSGINPPSNILKRDRLFRFSKIFTNLSIASICLLVMLLLSSLIGPIMYVFAIVILLIIIIGMVVFTFGAVFTMGDNNPVIPLWNVLTTLTNANEFILKATAFCFNVTKWVAVAGIVLSCLAILFICLNKRKLWILKIVLFSLLIVVFALIFAVQVLTGGIQI